MLRMPPILPLASVLLLPLALGGCVGVAVVGGMAAAGGAGYAAASERGVPGDVDDFTLKTNIQDAWIKANPNYMNAFTATVYNGKVLVTGDATSPEMKRDVIAIAERVPGIKQLYDQIEVTSAPTAWDSAQDAWITAQLRSRLILEKGVRSDNYTIETANHTVYLMGSARSQAELSKATYLASYVPGVRRVVSYVRIRPGMPETAEQNQPAMPMQPVQPGEPSETAPPASASPAPIQVQPL